MSNWQGHAGRSLIIAWQQALPLQNLLHIIDQNEVGLLQGKTGLDKLIKFTPVEVSLTNTVRRVLVEMAENRLVIDLVAYMYMYAISIFL